ncbi:MAG: hypothetical protein ING59_05550 [Burkholderiales bacterium]|nr:hypothetical protein [Burkholderiales bacterium]
MLINALPASDGIRWLKEGFRLVRQQPLGLPAMVVIYLAMLLIPAGFASSSLLPLAVLGIVISGVLSPFATVGLMHCVKDAAEGKAPMPQSFARPFKDEAARLQLFRLGLVNAALLAMVAVLAALFAPDVGDISGPPTSLDDPRMMAMLWQIVLYLPVLAVMWFSPMLAGWHRMTPGKAMFGSAVASLRNLGALVMYGLATAGAILLISLVLVGLLSTLIRSPELLSFVLAPVALGLMAVVQASFYPMYRDIFH